MFVCAQLCVRQAALTKGRATGLHRWNRARSARGEFAAAPPPAEPGRSGGRAAVRGERVPSSPPGPPCHLCHAMMKGERAASCDTRPETPAAAAAPSAVNSAIGAGAAPRPRASPRLPRSWTDRHCELALVSKHLFCSASRATHPLGGGTRSGPGRHLAVSHPALDSLK
jgi:hypothetical protein